MRNIFPEKSYTNSGGETSPRLFSKKLKLSISWSNSPKLIEYILEQQSKVNRVCFYCMHKPRAIEIC